MPKIIKEPKKTTKNINSGVYVQAFERSDTNIKNILRLNHAHQKLLSCAAENDVKGMDEALEQKIDINYVQAFFRNDIRCEHTALIIALQKGYSEATNFLIGHGADVNQALSLVFIYFSEEDSLQSNLVAKGADVKLALRLAIEHNWDDETQERLGKARILLLALKRQPENVPLHDHLISRGADINRTLWLVIEKQPNDDKLISQLTSKKVDINRTLWLVMQEQPNNSAVLISWLVSNGGDVDRALRMAIEQEWINEVKADLIPCLVSGKVVLKYEWSDKIREELGKARALLLALMYQPKNASLHNHLTSQGAKIDIALCLVMVEQADNRELISRLIAKGANIDRAFRMASTHVWDDETQEELGKKKLLLLVSEYQLENIQLSKSLISPKADINKALSVAVINHPQNDALILKLISGADANYVIDSNKNCCVLHEAINRECSKQVIQGLLEHGANPNENMIVARNGCEQMGFALMTLTNPIGWFYLSYLFCARGDCGNPFKEKHVDAIGLARLRNHVSAEDAILEYREKIDKGANERTPLLKGRGEGNGFFSSREGKRESGGHHNGAVIINMPDTRKGIQ